jgi:hypothetical protein
MSSRTILLAVLSLCAVSAYSADWGSFVAASTSVDDELILGILQNADFETSLQICEALGERKDPHAADILSWLLAGFSEGGQYKTEYLIRIAMKSLFDPTIGDQALRDRLDANASVLADMVKGIDDFHDPQLEGIIVQLLPHLGGMNQLSALMKVGTGVIGHLQQAGGALLPPDTGLAIDFLAAVQAIGDADFLEPCLTIARLSRDEMVSQRARQVAHLLTDQRR